VSILQQKALILSSVFRQKKAQEEVFIAFTERCDFSLLLERRSRKGKEEIDRRKGRWLAKEKRTDQE
jgi:hypothetical protein